MSELFTSLAKDKQFTFVSQVSLPQGSSPIQPLVDNPLKRETATSAAPTSEESPPAKRFRSSTPSSDPTPISRFVLPISTHDDVQAQSTKTTTDIAGPSCATSTVRGRNITSYWTKETPEETEDRRKRDFEKHAVDRERIIFEEEIALASRKAEIREGAKIRQQGVRDRLDLQRRAEGWIPYESCKKRVSQLVLYARSTGHPKLTNYIIESCRVEG